MTGGDFILIGIQWLMTILLNRKSDDSTPYAVGLFLPLLTTGVAMSRILDNGEVGTLTVAGALCAFYGWFAATSLWMVVSGHYLHTTKKGRADLRYKHNPYLYTFDEGTRTAAWRASLPSGAMLALAALISANQADSPKPNPLHALVPRVRKTSGAGEKAATQNRRKRVGPVSKVE